MPRKQPPNRGDLIQITWRDCTEDAVGDPETAKCAKRITYGLFWKQTDDTLVTTSTVDEDVAHQSGWAAYPLGMVVGIKVIKRNTRR